MELQVTTLEGKSAGKVTLDDTVFGLEPRADLIQRMVRYQLLKRMSGTHDVKNRAEVSQTGKKFGRQKGGGGARRLRCVRGAVPPPGAELALALLRLRHRGHGRLARPSNLHPHP